MALAAEIQLDPAALDELRPGLVGYCYRMLGSVFEADDAVQETMMRAWASTTRFEGRSSLRTWIYRIATNVSIDILRGRQRRATPMDFGPASTVEAMLTAEQTDQPWLLPLPDARLSPERGDPADLVVNRETIRLAFVAALQHLPPRQRAVLILREVLAWPAADVADLLDTTVASVNSGLQRARATLAATDLSHGDDLDGDDQALLDNYVDAFQRYDIQALVKLLHDDAIQSMPPYALWLRGAGEIGRFMLGPGSGCRGSRLIRTRANGGPAFGQYRSDGHGGHYPWALLVPEIRAGRIAALTAFLDTDLFAAFGLPASV
jgi:RNA polymerase sigma-70 factor (ECF subfamily)